MSVPVAIAVASLRKPRHLACLLFIRNAVAGLKRQVIPLIRKGVRPAKFVVETEVVMRGSRLSFNPNLNQTSRRHVIPKANVSVVFYATNIKIACIGVSQVVTVSDEA